MGKEATSWDWLRSGIKRVVPAYSLLERVENGIGAGMADVNYVIRTKEGWIELKAVALPKRPGTAVLGEDGLRDPDQINWHLKRGVMGSRTWVFITAGDYRWLVSGAHARIINDLTVDGLCHYARIWHRGTWKEAQWQNLIAALVS